jgi:hypothetical protein
MGHSNNKTYRRPPESNEEKLKRFDEIGREVVSSKENSLAFLKKAGLLK